MASGSLCAMNSNRLCAELILNDSSREKMMGPILWSFAANARRRYDAAKLGILWKRLVYWTSVRVSEEDDDVAAKDGRSFEAWFDSRLGWKYWNALRNWMIRWTDWESTYDLWSVFERWTSCSTQISSWLRIHVAQDPHYSNERRLACPEFNASDQLSASWKRRSVGTTLPTYASSGRDLCIEYLLESVRKMTTSKKTMW